MTRKLIGLYQLITGIVGVIILLVNLYEKGFNTSVVVQIIAGVILYGLLAWTGYGLLNTSRTAVKYSRILQALQIVSFNLGGTLYKFTAAAYIALGYKDGGFTWGVAGQPIDFAITTTGGSSTMVIIYVVPIIILYGLSRIR